MTLRRILTLGLATAKESAWNPSVIAAVVAAMAAMVGAWLSYRGATRANATSDRKVDLEEHRDNIARLQAIITEQDRYQERLRAQIDRMNHQLDSVQSQLLREQDVSQVLRSQVATLQDQVRVLQRMVDDQMPRRRAAGQMRDKDLQPPQSD